MSSMPLICGCGGRAAFAQFTFDIRAKYASFLQHVFSVTVADFFIHTEPNACGGFLRGCFSYRKSIVPPDIT